MLTEIPADYPALSFEQIDRMLSEHVYLRDSLTELEESMLRMGILKETDNREPYYDDRDDETIKGFAYTPDDDRYRVVLAVIDRPEDVVVPTLLMFETWIQTSEGVIHVRAVFEDSAEHGKSDGRIRNSSISFGLCDPDDVPLSTIDLYVYSHPGWEERHITVDDIFWSSDPYQRSSSEEARIAIIQKVWPIGLDPQILFDATHADILEFIKIITAGTVDFNQFSDSTPGEVLNAISVAFSPETGLNSSSSYLQ